jgi:hypothetical protein
VLPEVLRSALAADAVVALEHDRLVAIALEKRVMVRVVEQAGAVDPDNRALLFGADVDSIAAPLSIRARSSGADSWRIGGSLVVSSTGHRFSFASSDRVNLPLGIIRASHGACINMAAAVSSSPPHPLVSGQVQPQGGGDERVRARCQQPR